MLCASCGAPATCIGVYDPVEVEEPACDACCQHGNEDGWCEPIDGEHDLGGQG
jgi:hypothetical protein